MFPFAVFKCFHHCHHCKNTKKNHFWKNTTATSTTSSCNNDILYSLATYDPWLTTHSPSSSSCESARKVILSPFEAILAESPSFRWQFHRRWDCSAYSPRSRTFSHWFRPLCKQWKTDIKKNLKPMLTYFPGRAVKVYISNRYLIFLDFIHFWGSLLKKYQQILEKPPQQHPQIAEVFFKKNVCLDSSCDV